MFSPTVLRRRTGGLGLALWTALASATAAEPAPGLAPARLRCEYLDDPVGVDEAAPRLSWILESRQRAHRQQAYEIQAATSPARLEGGEPDLWRSGRVASAETAQIPYGGQPLASSRPVYWRVRVWDEHDLASPWSPTATWTTALLAPADWRARWITTEAQPPNTPGLPLFRHEFTVNRPVQQALIHVCGLGHYELLIDGRKVGDRFLDPAWSQYSRTAYYTTYDVTAAVRQPGRHAFGVMLGKGFFNTAGDRRIHGVDARRPLQLILQAQLLFADGTEEFIGSDESWRTAPGPITHSAILGGEDHDARRSPDGWAAPGFDDRDWKSASPGDGPGGQLRASLSPPMKVRATFAPRRIDEPEPGIFVYDFGQNASAIPRLRVRGRPGDTVKLTPAEQRHGMTPRRNDGRGLVNPAGVGSPNYFRYTLRGDPGGESWSPRFSYSGFQYLQVEGAVPAGQPNPDGRPVIEELVSLHVRNDAPVIGTFTCSDPLLNDIDRLVARAVESNLAHVLTDCPHREKLGWLEVSYLLGPAIAGRFDIARFYSKISRDASDAQGVDGRVPTVAPAFPKFSGGFQFTPEWGAAAVVNPWLVYEWTGDRDVLRRQFDSMKAYVRYLAATAASVSPTNLVPIAGLGDWYDYGHGQPVGESRFTSPQLSAMATFHRCARIVADSAHVLGLAEEERNHRELAQRIASAFNTRWFDGRAEYQNSGSPQTANAMALEEGIVPPDRAPAVLARIIDDLQQRHLQQTSGDVGYWYLLQALARGGQSELLHTLVTRTNLGSYGFIVGNGWTSMPEAWDADTGASMNHCMLGHIQEWFLGWVAGIRPDPEHAGFSRFIIEPHPVGKLTWARGTHDSIRGPIAVTWRRGDRTLEIQLRLPPNTVARVGLPARPGAILREGGEPVEGRPGIQPRERTADRAWFDLEGGDYSFAVEL